MKKRNQKNAIFLCLLAVWCFFKLTAAWASPLQQWAIPFDGPLGLNDYASDLVADDAGNIYVTGSASYGGFYGYDDVVIIKIDHLGNIVWVRNHDHLGYDDVGRRIEIDPFGQIVVVGAGQGNFSDILLLKYDPDGNLICHAAYNKSIGGISTPDSPWDMTIDQNGNILITGATGGYGTNPDYITLKYNADCKLEWEQRYDGFAHKYDIAQGIAVDSVGAVVVTGFSDQGSGTTPDNNYVTIKYSASGTLLWSKTYNGSSGFSNWDAATDVVVNMFDEIYVTGGSGSDYVTIKYDSSGSMLWEDRFNLNAGSHIKEAAKMVLDDDGNVYIAGGSGPDFATFKYNTWGMLMWYELYDGPNGKNDYARDIAIDKHRNVFVTGYTNVNQTADYITIMYDEGGTPVWASPERYNSPDQMNDMPAAIAVDCAGSVFVTGSSQRVPSQYDITTLKYVPSVTFRRGDVNCDGQHNLSDTFMILAIVYGSSAVCMDAADSNDDGYVNILDVFHSLFHVAFGGPQPPAPYPGLGYDPTPDCLDCLKQCGQ